LEIKKIMQGFSREDTRLHKGFAGFAEKKTFGVFPHCLTMEYLCIYSPKIISLHVLSHPCYGTDEALRALTLSQKRKK
jgi:hypothetical protein